MPKVPTSPPANAAANVPTATEVEPIYPQLDPYAEHTAEGSQQDGGLISVLLKYAPSSAALSTREMNEPSCTKSTAGLSTSLMALTQRWLQASLGMGAAGVGLLSTVIAAPVVVALEAAALVCGLAGMAGKYASRRPW